MGETVSPAPSPLSREPPPPNCLSAWRVLPSPHVHHDYDRWLAGVHTAPLRVAPDPAPVTFISAYTSLPDEIFSKPSPSWTIHCDGSAVPNPGRMGLGAVLVAPDGTRHVLSRATDARGCNNEAEARALMLALREAQARGATVLQIYSDSSLLVAQLGSGGAPPVLRLAALYEEVAGLLAGFAQASLHWIPRHRNGEADALARAALGLAPKVAVKLSKKKKRR